MLHVSGLSSGQTFLKTVGSEFATWVGLQIMIVRRRRREIHPVSSASGTIGDTLISEPIRRLRSWGVAVDAKTARQGRGESGEQQDPGRAQPGHEQDRSTWHILCQWQCSDRAAWVGG